MSFQETYKYYFQTSWRVDKLINIKSTTKHPQEFWVSSEGQEICKYVNVQLQNFQRRKKDIDFKNSSPTTPRHEAILSEIDICITMNGAGK